MRFNVLLSSFPQLSYFVCDRLETTWGQAGPASASELQLWVSQILGRLDRTQRSGVKRFLTSASYSTAYSGCGFFESIVHQLSMHLGIQRPPTCTHAFEVQAKARAALLCTDLGDSPGHVYGDLCGVFPGRTIRKLLKVQKVLLRECRRQVRAGQTTKRDGLNSKGIELLRACDGLLSQHQPAATAYCYAHKCHCAIPRAPVGSSSFHAAGTTCVDFSQRSTSQLRLLGRHMIVFACWAHGRRLAEYSLVLHECVAPHPSAWLLRRYLGKTHVVISYILCPSIFGHPCTRKRRFTLALARSQLQTPLCESLSPAGLFTFNVVASGDIYVSALPVEIDSYLAARGVSTWRQLLCPGALRRHM